MTTSAEARAEIESGAAAIVLLAGDDGTAIAWALHAIRVAADNIRKKAEVSDFERTMLVFANAVDIAMVELLDGSN